MNKSPLRYPGGKTRACKVLKEIFNLYFNGRPIFNCICSPFFGGGSFEFYLSHHLSSILTQYEGNENEKIIPCQIFANDKFTPLYNFWSQCKKSNSSLIENIEEHFLLGKMNKQKFQLLREQIMDSKDPLQQATFFFILNRTSFSGSTLSGGFSKEAAKKRFILTSYEVRRYKIINPKSEKFIFRGSWIF